MSFLLQVLSHNRHIMAIMDNAYKSRNVSREVVTVCDGVALATNDQGAIVRAMSVTVIHSAL